MAVEYALTYQPSAPLATGSGVHNAKSKPMVIPAAAPGAVPNLPTTPGGLATRQGAPSTGGGSSISAPGGAAPTSGAPVTNAYVYSLIERYFPQSQWDNANRVSSCESGQRNVVSLPNFDGSTDYGVFQLNSAGTLPRLLNEFGYPSTDLTQALDADWNVHAASLLWQQRGWQPWVCAAKLQIVSGLWSSQPGPGAH